MNRLLVLVCASTVWFLLLSCGGRSQKQPDADHSLGKYEITYSDHGFNLDAESLTSYQLFDCYKKTFFGYNFKTHAIDVFEVGTEIRHIPLATEGVDAILPGVSYLYVHSPDSIFVESQLVIYRIDALGRVCEKYNTSELLNKPGTVFVTMKNYSTANIHFYYDKEKNSFWGFVKELKTADGFSVCEVLSKGGPGDCYDMDVPAYFSKNKGAFGWKDLPNITISEGVAYYNFPIESTVYALDLKTGERKSFSAQSVYVDNKIETTVPKASFDESEAHKVKNSHFFELLHDPYRRLFYRLQLGNYSYSGKENMVSDYSHKPIYLSIFDENMNSLQEVQLESDLYNYATSWCVGEEGLFLTMDNIHSKKNFEKLELRCITVSKK